VSWLIDCYRTFRRFIAPAVHFLVTGVMSISAASFDDAAKSTNEFGLQLYRSLGKPDSNLCISPYSISCALAMALAGADGDTRTEMARVLHLDPSADSSESFGALHKALDDVVSQSVALIKESKKTRVGSSDPISLAVANRLFPQTGYAFRKEFFSLLEKDFGAAPEPLDFSKNAATATKRINQWVAEQTQKRIKDLIPKPLDSSTRLVLANAIYLKAPWQTPFEETATKPRPFHINGREAKDVDTMTDRINIGYAKRSGYTAVAIPYIGTALQFVILLPDEINGLPALEKRLDSKVLAECAKLDSAEVDLYLPKFKFEPPTIQLASQLQTLGMKKAFDIPTGSANFDRIAPRKPDDYLAISDVYHKTFIAVDEKGTEAAAATAVVIALATSAMGPERKPIEVKVDRPFVYAIQHVASGACLFLGRVTDPR
jgi:serpin B